MGKTYHREHLEADLRARATAYIDAHGAQTLSLRKIAAELKVSPMAAYHYFPSKDALLATLAEAYRVELYENIQSAIAPGAPAREQLMAFGNVYVRYAVAYPERFAVMFDPRYTLAPEELARTDSRLFGEFAALAAEHFNASGETGTRTAFSLWSSVHGFALMASAGPLTSLTKDKKAFDAYLAHHLAHLVR